MSSVTQRVSQIKQPYGGYLRPRDFECIVLNDDNVLSEQENIHPSLVGMAVDYLSRYMLERNAKKAFHISLLGASIIDDIRYAIYLTSQIQGLDKQSIICACKLCGYDVCYRSSPTRYRPVENIEPDQETINNIRIMVNRSLHFFEIYGPIVKNEITFEGGYSALVTAGDGDYLTENTLWDFKVSKRPLTTKSTLQILMYYIMSQCSIHQELKKIEFLGFFNPRQNKVYIYSVKQLDKSIIEIVSKDVIGYDASTNEKGMDTCLEKECNCMYFDDDENFDDDIDDFFAPQYLTVTETAQYLGVKRSEIYKLICSNVLDAYKEKNKYKISLRSIEDYIKHRKLMTNICGIICGIGILFLGVIYFLKKYGTL